VFQGAQTGRDVRVPFDRDLHRPRLGENPDRGEVGRLAGLCRGPGTGFVEVGEPVRGDDGKKFVYVEAQGTSALETDPKRAALAAARYGIIRSQALTPRESMELIERLSGEL
jgi:hypothetical protein